MPDSSRRFPHASPAAARTRGRTVLAVVYALLACNAWAQALLPLVGRSDDPPALTTWQVAIGATGAATAWGAWRGARWAPAAAIVHALVTAGMLLTLAPLLDLPADAVSGLRSGAALVMLFGIWAAWLLRRAVRRAARTAGLVLLLALLADPLHAAAPRAAEHRCAADARTSARKLLTLHVGDDDRMAVDSAVTTLAPLRNPAGGGALDVLQVQGFVYKARYRMRFLYAPVRGQCVLMGQEILELARV
ncbi:MAG: hypothetical protein ACXW0Z_15385 [Gemmatirosa sp.]